MYTGKNHTFVICAYKENPHLEETVKTLLNQTVKSKVIISTSTPNAHIKNICEKYGLELFVNPHPNMAGDDWNYGYTRAKTELVTIAHQDDLYESQFLETTLKYINKRRQDDVIIAFTDYYELRNNKKVVTNTLLRIKRIMNFLLRFPLFYGSRFIRRRSLSVGCAICCPAVTFVKKNAGKRVFDTEYKNSCDYKTWVNLSAKSGSFIYIPRPLMAHRIYAESATTLNLSENIRKKEDLEIMCGFWPWPIAKLINMLYAKSEKSNELK